MSTRLSALCLLAAGLAACDAADPASSPAAAPADLGSVSGAALDASALFIGTVVSIEPRLSEPDASGRVVPFRFVTWQVERASFGVEDGQTWTGRFAGGELPDGRTLWVSEVPEFEVGQRALIAASDAEHGSCALVACRDGMALLDGDGGPWDLAAEQLVDGLADAARPLVGSADPERPFAFLGAPRTSKAGLEAAQARGAARLARAVRAADGADLDELEALSANDWNPVLSR